MNLEELMQQWEHDSKIDDNHLGEASTESPNLHSKYINTMVSYIQMEQKVEYLNTIVYFLEEVLRQIRQRDWQIRTAVDWKKFLVGM